MKICVYEDIGYKWFGPLTDTRASWDLRCGAFTLDEKIRKRFKSFDEVCHVRSNLVELYPEKRIVPSDLSSESGGNEWLFINGRVILDDQSVNQLTEASEDTLFFSDETVAAFKLSGDNLGLITPRIVEPIDYSSLDGLRKVEINAAVMSYPWQLVNAAGKEIEADLRLATAEDPGNLLSKNRFAEGSIIDNLRITGEVEIRPGVIIDAEKYPVRLEVGVRIAAGVIIDASKGPVWIAEGARIEAGAILMGPVFIGSGSIIRPGARLSDGVCLGPQCRIGGEVSKTIIQGYTNKQHSGYLGTSYLGSWVNLGAATDNSDLKNNYQPVAVPLNGEMVESSDLHAGVFIGDFTRTAIQTRLNSGTVVGVGCNLFGSDFPEKNIPAFTWVSSEGYDEYRKEKALDTIRTMMSRRGRELTPELETLLRVIFAGSQGVRDKLLQRAR